MAAVAQRCNLPVDTGLFVAACALDRGHDGPCLPVTTPPDVDEQAEPPPAT